MKKENRISDSESEEEERALHTRGGNMSHSCNPNMWTYPWYGMNNGAMGIVVQQQPYHCAGAAPAQNNGGMNGAVPHTAFVPNGGRKNEGQGNHTNWGQNRFQGNCNYCGQKGHMERHCPLNPPNEFYRGNNGNRERVPCAIFGDLGHLTEKCWEDPRNSGIRPNTWHSKLPGGPILDSAQICYY